MKPTIRIACLSVLGVVLSVVRASPGDGLEEAARAKTRLAEVRSRIDALAARLGGELHERDALGARLRDADLRIMVQRRRVEELRGAESALERRAAELGRERASVQRALDGERAGLAAQLRAAYAIGRRERLKLLLNQDDAAGAGRMVAFYGYFARERARRIDEIRNRSAELAEVLAQLETAAARLGGLRAAAATALDDLQHARGDRAAALRAVSAQLDDGHRQLEQLNREAAAEEALLAELARVIEAYPADEQQNFGGLRGKLPWPVPGRMTARFKDARGAGEGAARANGILIEAGRGAKVRAPAFGRVVYADWLQGMGLLLIIAHPGDYLTLYGHAEVLYKSVGDKVAAGDVVAGLSELAAAPSLYFEIRAGRTAQDPKLWLKSLP